MSKKDGWEGFNPASFGARLRELRTEARLTQGELAEKAGSHERTISKIERGEVDSPAFPLVLALAAALGVGVEAFTEEPAEADAPRIGRPKKKRD